MPNHRMTIGKIARCGTLRIIWIGESKSTSATRESPVHETEHEPDAPPDQKAERGSLKADREMGPRAPPTSSGGRRP